MHHGVSQTILEMRGISKIFPGIKALEGVNFAMRSGEVHALIGENGAGKSTLVKVLTGVYRPSEGSIVLDGRERAFRSPEDARKAGIACIHQDASMFPDLSVAENIFSGHLLRSKAGLLDWGRMRREAEALLSRVELAVKPDSLVRELSVAERHLVGIARALSENASLVIMDEPTSALSLRETRELFKIIRALRAEGKAILFISHKFDELFEIADSFTVLRDGRYAGEGSMKEASVDSLVKMMAGRELDRMYPSSVHEIGEETLSVEGFSRAGYYKDVSFALRRGEVLGLFGLVGAGRSDVIRSLMGLEPRDSGRITLRGKEIRIANPKEALRHGIAHVPEDRQAQGLVLDLPISDNISLPQVSALSKAGFLDRKAEESLAHDYGTRMEIRAAGWGELAKNLSGGNQQKVVLAKWLATEPAILILDEPTKGIDIGTKAAVHSFIASLAAKGLSILMISSELPEILGMSDRILVMYEGRVTALLGRAEADEAKVMYAATGLESRGRSA